MRFQVCLPSIVTSLALLLLTFMGAQNIQAAQYIVQDGRSSAQIIIAPNASRMTRLAASELQQLIVKIAGAKLPINQTPAQNLPIHLYVGVSEHTQKLGIDDQDLKHGAYRMISGDHWLALVGCDLQFSLNEPWAHSRGDRPRVLKEWDDITGHTWRNPMQSVYKGYNPQLKISEYDQHGSLNAVYAYMYSLGARWYMPGEENELLPKLSTLELPKVNRVVRPDFAVRNLHLYNRFWVASPEEVLWQLRLGLNPGMETVGLAAFTHGTTYVHGRQEVQQAHPEFFALWGKRAVDMSGSGKPCLSSQGLFEQNVAYARALLDQYDTPFVSVMPADGYSLICQCELCKGKDTPERGYRGRLSDYVWDYVNRVAIELYKSHPDRKVVCFAYGTYLLPPEKIQTLSPNIIVGLCGWRSMMGDQDIQRQTMAMRQQWLKKISGEKKFLQWDYYLHGRPNAYGWDATPVVFPHLVAADLKSLKGQSYGEYVETYREHREEGWLTLATNHLNIYITSRLYWDANADVDAMLQEYYKLFYSSASLQAQKFFEYCEQNWTRMKSDQATITRMFELLRDAQAAAGQDTGPAKRLALIAQYVAPLEKRMEQLTQNISKPYMARPNARRAKVVKSKGMTVTIDGKLNDAFWNDKLKYALVESQTGSPTTENGTVIKLGWMDDAMYIGIRCYDKYMDHLNVTATKPDDEAIWFGDSVDILLETHEHAYYQIAVNPAGTMADADREKTVDLTWESGVQAAVHRYDNHWSVEIRIPVIALNDQEKDALQNVDAIAREGITGVQPSSTLPWYFNICRQRVRADVPTQRQAFSATGSTRFNIRKKFAEIYVE